MFGNDAGKKSSEPDSEEGHESCLSMVSLPITDDFEESSIDSDFNEEIYTDEEIVDDMCFEEFVDKEVELIGNDEEKCDTTDRETDGESEVGFESSPSDCDHEYTNIFDEVDAYNPSYELNQVFSCKKIFRESIHSHAIQTRRNIKIVKNDGRRVYAKCLGLNCEWRINLLKIEKEESWQVREYHYKHKCCESMNNSNVKSNWIAKRFEEEFRSDAKRNTQGFRLDVIRQIRVNVSRSQAYRAKRKALNTIDGTYEGQYGKLWDYADMLRTTNPGSTVIMALEEASGSNNSPKRFSKFYICFDAMKKGFLSGCRPIIGVDGCFLKGPHQGQLLTACALDPNNDTYVIAYAVVKSETRENWEWFLTLLKEDLMIERTDLYTFMSDKQKGLIPAFETVFPGAEHRFCVRHLHGNMKVAGFRGSPFKNALWTAARASTIPEFSKAKEEMGKLDPRCLEWLHDKPPSQWSRSHFKKDLKCDILTNNMCESFNSCILDARDRPILTMLEWIRQYLMKKISTYRDRAQRKWEGRILCGRIAKMLARRTNKAADCIPLKADDRNYEIECFDGSRFTVDLRAHTCSCRKWDISGIPCKHAASAIYAQGLNPEDFVDKCYTVVRYGLVYEHNILPVDGPMMWHKTGYVAPLPPKFGRRAGRPTKARRHEPDQLFKKGKKRPNGNGERDFRLGKQKYSVTCKYCGETGHNQRTCAWKKTAQEFGIDETVEKMNHEAEVDKEMIQAEKTTHASSFKGYKVITKEGRKYVTLTELPKGAGKMKK